MHIELTEMLRCPEKHQEEFLVLSTVEMSGRMVARGLLGCPVCHKEYEIANGVVEFGGISTHHAPPFFHGRSSDRAGPPRPLRTRRLRRPRRLRHPVRRG